MAGRSRNITIMIGGEQNCFSIRYAEKAVQSRQLHRYSESACMGPYESGESYRAAYNPQPFLPSRKPNLSPSPTANTHTLTRRRSPQKTSFQINKQARIDIELFEEGAEGGRWERMRGRVVYRNNTPKNSFYLLSSMRGAPEAEQGEERLPGLSSSLSRDELEFNSKFESGNAAAVVRLSREEYCVFTREDTNSHGLRQWFYFEVKCHRAIRARLRVYSFSKAYSLYRQGMKPYLKTQGSEWRQAGEDVAYARDPVLGCYFLSFTLALAEGELVQVANMPPYTYSCLLRFLGGLQAPALVGSVGSSLGGVDIPSIAITRPPKPDERRPAVVLLARTHPGETCSNFTLEQIVRGICASELLRDTYDFFIVPMVNPDGVIAGNHRTSLAGSDLNRRFVAVSAFHELFPEVEAVKRLVRSVQQSHVLHFLFDLHGHSAKPGAFAYAGEELPGSPHFLKSRILPRLIAQAWHGFTYSECAFEQVREKTSTARVHFRSRCNITSLTFQQSYGLLGRSLIAVSDWRAFGEAFLTALAQYTRLYLHDPAALAQALEEETRMEAAKYEAKQPQKDKEEAAKQSTEGPSKDKLVEKAKQEDSPTGQGQSGGAGQDEAESLSSGDEDLQIREAELDFILENMNVRRREAAQRQPYELNDNTIQYEHAQPATRSRHRTIHDKLPLVSRILRTKQPRQPPLIDILTSRGKHASAHREPLAGGINASLRLPSLPHNRL